MGCGQETWQGRAGDGVERLDGKESRRFITNDEHFAHFVA
jgi:hypothetical protein